MTLRFGVLLPVVLAAVAALSLTGCGGSSGAAHSAADYEHVYKVRARVTQLPDGSPGGGFLAHHEPIPEYVTASGSLGMNAMVMPFTIVDESVLEGIAVGDFVEIEFGETHRPRVRQGVIAIKKLPADTELDFGGEATP